MAVEVEVVIINIKLRGGWQMSQIRKEYQEGWQTGAGWAKQIISVKCSQCQAEGGRTKAMRKEGGAILRNKCNKCEKRTRQQMATRKSKKRQPDELEAGKIMKIQYNQLWDTH